MQRRARELRDVSEEETGGAKWDLREKLDKPLVFKHGPFFRKYLTICENVSEFRAHVSP